MIWLARQKPMQEGNDELASLCRRMGMDYEGIIREEVVEQMRTMKEGLETAARKRQRVSRFRILQPLWWKPSPATEARRLVDVPFVSGEDRGQVL